MLGYFPLICKPHFQPPASGGAAARDRRRQRLPPFRGGTGPAAGRRKGFDRAGGAADGAREGEAPQAAAKGGTGQGKRHGGTGRARITSGGRTVRAASYPGFDQAGRHGAAKGKGKGGRQAARKGKGRGLCGTVARVSTREKKNPACGGACKGGACAGFIHRRRIVSGSIDQRIR